MNTEVNLVSDELLDFRQRMERWQTALGDESGINSRQIDALAYALLNNGIRPRDYMKYMHASHETARRELGELAEMGLLRPSGKGRARKYLLIDKGD